MSEERFDTLETAVAELKAEVSGLKGELKAEVSGLRDELKAEVSGLRSELKAEVSGLRHYMGVIREDLLDSIRASAVPEERLRRKCQAGLDELREDTDQRLRPLEVVVAQHSKDIASLKKRRA